MSRKAPSKSKKAQRESDSSGESHSEGDDEPTLAANPALKPVGKPKPSAAPSTTTANAPAQAAAPPQPPPPAQAPPASVGASGKKGDASSSDGEVPDPAVVAKVVEKIREDVGMSESNDPLYDWETAKRMAGKDLAALYGDFGQSAMPFKVRDALGDHLCPNKDGTRDFYFQAEDITLENVKKYYEQLVEKVPQEHPLFKAVKTWHTNLLKKSLVAAFNDTASMMTQEIHLMVARLNEASATNPEVHRNAAPPPAAAAAAGPDQGASAASGGKRKSAAQDPAQDTAPAIAPVQKRQYQSIDDVRRSLYRRRDGDASFTLVGGDGLLDATLEAVGQRADPTTMRKFDEVSNSHLGIPLM